MRRSVLITGAAGTVGTAFVRHLVRDHDVVALDSSEWALAQLAARYPAATPLLRDFADFKFNECPVDAVIHCAAYKHVELGEADPAAFTENNVTKTQKLFEMASWYNADILFVSTDKAVEPVSAYGFTKALGEKLCWKYGGTVARFGNVLGSSGSVIPVWDQAIAFKDPLKVTDERMVRYVVEDTEAVTAAWDGFLAGEKLVVPEMEEVRLMDLLADVLGRHGFDKASDYGPGVEVIGMRPGEKLREKIKWDHEL